MDPGSDAGRPTIVIACIKCKTRSPDLRGSLCPPCAERLVCADWHVPGVVRSTVAAERAAAWLIDPWGQPHAIAPVTTIGRAAGNDVVISDRNVSAEHAELRAAGDAWRVRDRGSTGGTRVGARRDVRVDVV